MFTRQTFKREERLRSKKLIAKLFNEGKFFFHYPFKIIFIEIKKNEVSVPVYPAQVIITIPKRNFKRAVRRNLIKRRIREAYRKNKADFYEKLTKRKKTMIFGFIYTAKELPEYNNIEQKIISALNRLVMEIGD